MILAPFSKSVGHRCMGLSCGEAWADSCFLELKIIEEGHHIWLAQALLDTLQPNGVQGVGLFYKVAVSLLSQFLKQDWGHVWAPFCTPTGIFSKLSQKLRFDRWYSSKLLGSSNKRRNVVKWNCRFCWNFLIIDSIFLLFIGLFRFSISFYVNFGNLYVSRNFSISSRLSIFLMSSCSYHSLTNRSVSVGLW